MSEVLHHLGSGNVGEFPKAAETLKEAKRVTVPCGVIVITTSLPEAITNSAWMSQLNSKISERFNNYNPSLEKFEQMLRAANISLKQKFNILGQAISKDYFDYEGPLHESWRKGSSYWKLATEEELEDVKKKILDLKSRGELEQWVMKHDHSATAGVITMLTCKCDQ